MKFIKKRWDYCVFFVKKEGRADSGGESYFLALSKSRIARIRRSFLFRTPDFS